MSWLHHFFLPRPSNNHRARILHPSVLSLIVGLFALSQLFLGQLSRVYPQILGYASRIPPEEIIRLTNVRRQEQGLSALVMDTQLNAAAARKAADMFARDYWAHISPTGTQPWVFISDTGYAYRYAGENLARDFSDAPAIVQAWMDSPSHRENLLNARYQDIGVAVIDGKLSGRDTTLVVQMFGTRLAAAPAVNQTAGLVVREVKAQSASAPDQTPQLTPQPTPYPTQAVLTPVTPIASPFIFTKGLSLLVLGVLAVVLLTDVVIINHRRIPRWTSKSLAHLIFISVLFVAAIAILRGQII